MTPRKPRQSPELLHQIALFDWIRHPATLRKYPELKLASCSLNGVKLSKAQAGKARASGMLAGEHDVRLPVARGGYTCLSVEMKAGDNRPSDKQLEYGELLEAEGGFVRYCWTWIEAKEVIEAYLAMPRLSFVSSGAKTHHNQP